MCVCVCVCVCVWMDAPSVIHDDAPCPCSSSAPRLYMSLPHYQLGLSFQIGVSRLSHGPCILSTTSRLHPLSLSLSLSLSRARALCLGCVPVCMYVCVCLVRLCARACACMHGCMHYALQSAAHFKTLSSSDTHCMHHASLFHTLSSSSFMHTKHHIYMHACMHTHIWFIYALFQRIYSKSAAYRHHHQATQE